MQYQGIFTYQEDARFINADRDYAADQPDDKQE